MNYPFNVGLSVFALTDVDDDRLGRRTDQWTVRVIDHHSVLSAGRQAADDVTGDVLLSESREQVM